MRLVLMLLLSVSFFVAAQDEKVDDTRFTPITEGNVLDFGPFNMTIPDGVLVALGSDAQYMYRLMHVDTIPNCEAIFFSASATWSYGVSLQWVPGSDFLFGPPLNAEQFNGLWDGRDIVSGKKDDKKRNIRFPFELNTDEASAFFGYETFHGEDHNDIVARKVYLSEEGVLVLTLRSEGIQHEAFEEEIGRIFSGMIVPSPPKSAQPRAGQHSFVSLFGIPLELKQEQPAEVAADAQEEGPNYLVSGVVIVAALGVLGAAAFMSRKS